jgi:hypothetical protein
MKMSDQRKWFVQALLVVFGMFGASVGKAQTPTCFTVASLQGTYAVVGTYGANVAVAFGIRNFDGNGNLTGTFVVNEPKAGSTTGERALVTGTQKGTYTVNCDGTGVITRVLTVTGGGTTLQMDDFMITAAPSFRGVALIATTLVDAQRVPSSIVSRGIFLTRTYTRLPDQPPQQ